jgi:hypothetical protein
LILAWRSEIGRLPQGIDQSEMSRLEATKFVGFVNPVVKTEQETGNEEEAWYANRIAGHPVELLAAEMENLTRRQRCQLCSS